MTNPDRACPHEDFQAIVEVNRLEDTGKFVMDLHVWCRQCEEAFVFPDRVPIGIDLGGIARSVDGKELRVAIRPETSVQEITGATFGG